MSPLLPHDRVLLRTLLERSGTSRSLFYQRYRHDPAWVERLDLQETPGGVLHVAAAAVPAFIAHRSGARVAMNARRAQNLGPDAQRGALAPSLRRQRAARGRPPTPHPEDVSS